MNILVIDDDRDGLEEMKRCHPGVIVLDLQMPVMAGPSFTQRLRSDGDETPVLVKSAKPFVPD